MPNKALELFSEELEKMNNAGQINYDALTNIRDAIKECKENELYWVRDTKIPPITAYNMYHATRNNRIILEKMEKRFNDAANKHDNPKVVDDALLIIPQIKDLCNSISSLKNNVIPPAKVESIKQRIRSLRSAAERVGMLPSAEEEIQTVKKTELKRELASITETAWSI